MLTLVGFVLKALFAGFIISTSKQSATGQGVVFVWKRAFRNPNPIA